MSDHILIGKRVMHRATKDIGTIESVRDGKVYVSDGFVTCAYPYPAAFADTLISEDEPGDLAPLHERLYSIKPMLKMNNSLS